MVCPCLNWKEPVNIFRDAHIYLRVHLASTKKGNAGLGKLCWTREVVKGLAPLGPLNVGSSLDTFLYEPKRYHPVRIQNHAANHDLQ